MSRLRRINRLWPAIPIVLVAFIVYAALPGRSKYTVSPETTYETQEVLAGGLIDYPTALHKRLSQGVTPENNANVLIWQALGPHPEHGTMPPEYFQWLGIKQPPEEGEYFIDSGAYFRAHLRNPPNDELGFINNEDRALQEEWSGRLDRAGKWPQKAKDQKDIASWLQLNEKPLALVIEASKRTEYYNPLVSKSNDPHIPRLIASLLPNVQKCRELANALKCRAMQRIAEGDFDGAWQDLQACQRLGRLVGKNGTLIEMLVGVSLLTIAIDGEITLLGNGPHSSKQLRLWLDELRKLPPFPPLADRFDVGERYMILDTLQSIATGGAKDLQRITGAKESALPNDIQPQKLFGRSIDWDPAFRYANQTFDRLAAASRIPDRTLRSQEYKKIEGELKSPRHTMLAEVLMNESERGESIGRGILQLLLPAINRLQDAVDRLEQSQNNLHIAFALSIFRCDTGKYPATLDELAPKYLPSVPVDLFSGKTLIYRPAENGYVFYSVGVNGLDNNGRGVSDNPAGDDLAVRMPISEPKEK